MNTQEIKCLLERGLNGTPIRFLGVFAADELPLPFDNPPYCYVLNTEPSNKPGAHWVAVFYSHNNYVEFFDSYAFPPNAYSDFHFPIYPLKWNTFSLQSINSQVCGHYCVYFLYLRCRNYTFDNIVRMLRERRSNKLMDKFVKRQVDLLSGSYCLHKACNCDVKLQCCKRRSK